jgi:hypothetical protein
MSLSLGWGASNAIRCGGVADSEAEGTVPVNCSQTWSCSGLKGWGGGGLAASVAIRCGDPSDLEAGAARRHASLGAGTVGARLHYDVAAHQTSMALVDVVGWNQSHGVTD